MQLLYNSAIAYWRAIYLSSYDPQQLSQPTLGSGQLLRLESPLYCTINFKVLHRIILFATGCSCHHYQRAPPSSCLFQLFCLCFLSPVDLQGQPRPAHPQLLEPVPRYLYLLHFLDPLQLQEPLHHQHYPQKLKNSQKVIQHQILQNVSIRYR